MDSQTYSRRRDAFVSAQMPFRAVEPQDLISTSENTYMINGLELAVEPEICEQLDAFIGVSRQQSKAVADTFGNNGIRDLRNYLALSNSIEKAGTIALIADPEQRKIIGATHLKKEAIPARSFFDFLDIFMSDNGYMPDRFYTNDNGQGGIMISLLPNNAVYDEFTPEEVFMTNGIWFRWNLGEVEAGNYYLRMTCSNGQMEAVERKIARTNRLDEASVRQMLSLPQHGSFIGANLQKMRRNALLAMRTDASVGEVRQANRLLARYGADDASVEEIAPYELLSDMYAKAGYDMKHFPLTEARSDINMWDLFNRITAFATHNKEWGEEDNRRSGLMIESVRLLNRPRDIKQYVSIF